MLLWIILLPFFGFLVNGTLSFFDKKKPLFAGLFATGCIFLPFLLASSIFLEFFQKPLFQQVQWVYPWIQLEGLHLPFSLVCDPLSILFVLVITGVGSFIHFYSIEYMQDDPKLHKYFAFLNLFCSAMLLLVLAGNLPLLFVGWEGVGLCSYCLIGFWYEDLEKAVAGKKAFIVNRIGDAAFLLACFWLYKQFGSLEFSVLLKENLLGINVTGICLLFFVACTGKSAQIPLYVWLPDAMAGPTPVSALIHAATMVTSGIYLINRLSIFFHAAPHALFVIAWIGVLTALFAGCIALFQWDIKKILAYSTISQLGFMFLACGVGAFSSGVFHVMTHAFFKALLFLGAGSVIHGNQGNQDIRDMGGLYAKMPKTAGTFLVGWLAICGIVPLSGFFSKDEILFHTFYSPLGSPFLWMAGVLAAFLTALYMTRLVCFVFFGTYRGKVHPHESGWKITMPLLGLAFFAIFAGLLGIPHAHFLERFLESVVYPFPHLEQDSIYAEFFMMVFQLGVAISGILIAFKLFFKTPLLLVERQGLTKFFEQKGYVDEFYGAFFLKPFEKLRIFFEIWVEKACIDQLVLRVGDSTFLMGNFLRQLHTGSLCFYMWILLLGVLAAVGLLFYGVV